MNTITTITRPDGSWIKSTIYEEMDNFNIFTYNVTKEEG
jgi:hypothetical protein